MNEWCRIKMINVKTIKIVKIMVWPRSRMVKSPCAAVKSPLWCSGAVLAQEWWKAWPWWWVTPFLCQEHCYIHVLWYLKSPPIQSADLWQTTCCQPSKTISVFLTISVFIIIDQEVMLTSLASHSMIDLCAMRWNVEVDTCQDVLKVVWISWWQWRALRWRVKIGKNFQEDCYIR